ncbi:hypothetical protein [Arsenophonus endosymbiont of Aleurodicus floccissimus]|nr:hypothetical protein [Arsenophonus endosymbiont of Aleurodicus floccissimus]
MKDKKCYVDRYFNDKGARRKLCQQYTKKLFSN